MTSLEQLRIFVIALFVASLVIMLIITCIGFIQKIKKLKNNSKKGDEPMEDTEQEITYKSVVVTIKNQTVVEIRDVINFGEDDDRFELETKKTVYFFPLRNVLSMVCEKA